MARFVYVVAQNESVKEKMKAKCLELGRILIPEMFKPNPPVFIEEENIFGMIFNPVRSVKVSGRSICLGVMMPEIQEWHIPGSEIPDGNFSMVRADDEVVEAITDCQATRTLWYYQDDDCLIISSSQRAIICLTGKFLIDRTTASWMLSSGTLGPGLSWDQRIKALPPSCLMKLNRSTWTASLNVEKIRFDTVDKEYSYHIENYFGKVEQTLEAVPWKDLKCAMLLTGGYDSRLILLLLLKHGVKASKYFTFGLKRSAETRLSDANIGQMIAKKYGLNWNYECTDYRNEDAEHFMNLFLICGEGRLDNLERFSDCFEMWKKLFEQGYDIVVIGSEGFSSQIPYYTEHENRFLRKIILMDDLANIPDEVKGDLAQTVPASFHKENGEDWPKYYNRLKQQFFNPYADAALNDPKTIFLEVINPLETKRVIDSMRSIPNEFRVGKRIVKEFVQKLDNSIPFYNEISVQRTESLLRESSIISYIVEYVSSRKSKQDILPIEFIDYVLCNYYKYETVDPHTGAKPNIKSLIKSKISKHMLEKLIQYKRRLTSRNKIGVDLHRLLFRIFIVLRVAEMFSSDAREFSKNNGS